MEKQEKNPETITNQNGQITILLEDLHKSLDYAFWQRRRIEESLLFIDSNSLNIDLSPETYLMKEWDNNDIVTILRFALNRVEQQGKSLAKIATSLDKLV